MTQAQQDKTDKKKAGAFRTIREVADHLDVEQHVLRFWETKFSQVKPLKRGGGRRYYRPEDIAVLETIHALLYKEKYTIKGAQKVLKGSTRNKIAANINVTSVVDVQPRPVKVTNASVEKGGLATSQVNALKDTLKALKMMRSTLEKVG